MPNVGGGYSKTEGGKVTRRRAPTATQVRQSRKKADPKPAPSDLAPTKPAKAAEPSKPKSRKQSGETAG